LARFLAQLERLRQVERAGLGTGLGGPADALRGTLLGAALAGALFTAALSFGLHLISADAPATHRVLATPAHTALLARDGAELSIAPQRGATHLSVPLRRVPGRSAPEAVDVVLLDADGERLDRTRWKPGAETALELQGAPATLDGPWRLRLEARQAEPGSPPALYLPADGLRWLRREGSSVHAWVGVPWACGSRPAWARPGCCCSPA
jgi:hypothetical protein